MASSRVSFPAHDSMPLSPSQLTPRSKVKAMLAVLDDNSDGEITSTSERPHFSSISESTSNMAMNNTRGTALEAKANASLADDAGDEYEDDEVIFKPRGRVAAAMLAASRGAEDEDNREGNTNLKQARGMNADLKELSPKVDTNHNNSGNSEGEDSPIVSRKRKIRRVRDNTSRSNSIRATSAPLGGIFVSPAHSSPSPPGPSESDDSGNELPKIPTANARFMALVEQKRKERLAKDAESQLQKAEKAAQLKRVAKSHSDILEDDAIEYSDEDGGRRLTQQARPTRKASKKALEEMHRETQRMSRNMQLAHEARTKKKITKFSLFAKFNYKPAGFANGEVSAQARQTSSSPAPQTDVEMKETPPTSPISNSDYVGKGLNTTNDSRDPANEDSESASVLDHEDIPSLQELLLRDQASTHQHQISKPDKGKGRALEETDALTTKPITIVNNAVGKTVHPVRILASKPRLVNGTAGNDSDSDLEIVPMQTPVRKSKESIFDRVPAKKANQSNSLHALRMLAHITSPGKQVKGRNQKPSMTAAELQMSLQQRARQQALRERDERLQVLRDNGIIVQTAEEREREMANMEDLIAIARREGEEIMKREKDAAKKERKAKGEMDPPGDSSDDEEWQEEKEKFAEQMSGSGSESDGDDEADASDEDDLDEDENEDAMTADLADALVDNEASETESEEEDAEGEDEMTMNFIDDGEGITDAVQEDDEELPAVHARRRTKHRIVLDDEEDDVANSSAPKPPFISSPLTIHNDSLKAPTSVLRSATKTFIPGLTVAGPAGLGLTQIFAGTMDDSQTQGFEGSPSVQRQAISQFDSAQDSLTFLRNLPQPDLPAFEPTMNDGSQEIIRDSQTQISQIPESPLIRNASQGVHLNFSQSQIHGFESMFQDPSATQLSEFPEPTQDAGFQEMSPIKGRFVEIAPSTIDTVVLQQTPVIDHVAESPVVQRKGKLRRRTEINTLPDNEQTETSQAVDQNDEDDFEISKNIFDVMRKASKQKEFVKDDFDKKKSGAKEMVYEQAEESEDEYAGLGGASDDESGGEEDAFIKEMIDDEGRKQIDERQLAAFYAEKERVNDEKQVEKLFKDITNGMLRRKRGADYDLSDSDDGGEARRRLKRAKEAKMRKALLEDERIGKIAENPKKMAFLRAIEDRGEDDEVDFLGDLGEAEESPDSQSHLQVDASQNEGHEDSNSHGAVLMAPPKRKLLNDSETETRLPPYLRRTQPTKRPSNLFEIRESLSSLIEEPNAILASNDVSESDSDLEIEHDGTRSGSQEKEKENRDPLASRRKFNISVVDRISLKRASSSNMSTTTRLAFATSSSTPGFKIPALLRRTNTNSSISSGSSSSVSGTERMAGGFGDDGRVTKKAGKNSGVNYFARENGRKAKLDESENKRKEKRWKGAEGRRKAVGGLFGMCKFD